jgi:uncharacterized protein (TIGR02266 family)
VTGRNQRRDRRFDVQLSLTLRQGNKSQALLTENVSYRGLFVRTDTPPPLRQLVKLEAVLPPDGVRFVTHGMSVFVIPPDDPGGRAPGAGIQFYGMGDERRAWEAFVNQIKPRAEGSAPTPLLAHDLKGPEPVRRKFERVPLVLEVRPTSVTDLLRMWTRDISAGGMFLSASQPPAIGAELRLAVTHPATGTVFNLDAIVRRHGDNPSGHGVGVEFVGMSEARRREFFRFITSTVPSMTPEELGLLEIE